MCYCMKKGFLYGENGCQKEPYTASMEVKHGVWKKVRW